ncbi:MAG TPA: FAD-dependent oxidoreductase [Myxococcaceae bacterium]|nr:FAD-dependent oxidoreductase [Myxococcaceae bacterium]
MLSPEDIASIPLFSGLSHADRERVAQAAADLHLRSGEYAVHEGEERALYAVLSGKIEVTKRMEGGEKTIAWRLPGTIFGEVPITLGTAFPGSFRASEPSRVLRLDARQYYVVAAAAPEVAVVVGTLARERLGGLQGLAAKPPTPQVTVIGHRWDPACHDLRRFVSRNQVVFDWLTPDSAELLARWPRWTPDGGGPALGFPDGTVLSRPALREVAQQLGLQTAPHAAEYDTIIVGGGPAGLAAAVYGASEGLRTLVVEREAPGGQAGTSSRIENYLGFPNGVSGDELAVRALDQAKRLGAEILVTRNILRLDPRTRQVFLDGDDVLGARTLIVATGVSWRRLAIEGIDRLIGKGVYYGAARSEAGNTQGLDVFLIGAGNSAGQAALHFASHARSVTLLVRGESLEKSMSRYLIDQVRANPNVRVTLRSEVRAVHGDDHLAEIEVADLATGDVQRRGCGGLFVFIGADAETDWLPEEIVRDARGYVLTGADLIRGGHWSASRDPYLLETSVPGIFACGDVRYSPVKRVASAVGEGSMAIAFVHQYLQHHGEASRS